MPSMDNKQSPQSMPLRAIEFLARKTDRSVEEIKRIYEQELAELSVGARVIHYLPVLTIRKVRGTLR